MTDFKEVWNEGYKAGVTQGKKESKELVNQLCLKIAHLEGQIEGKDYRIKAFQETIKSLKDYYE